MKEQIYTEVYAKVRLLALEEGGRSTPAMLGYRPHMQIPAGLFSAAMQWIKSGKLMPGEESEVLMLLVHPLTELQGLAAGAVFDLAEGNRKIGVAQILDVHERAGDT